MLEIDGFDETGEDAWAGTPDEGISLWNLTDVIPKPTTGFPPTAVVVTGEYIGVVGWDPEVSGFFAGGETYTAEATLYPLSGYTFGDPVGDFTYSGLNPVTTDTKNGTVTVRIAFPATVSVAAVPVTDLDLTAKVPAPVRGGTPVTYFAAPQYTGTVAWSPSPSGVFDGGTPYTAAVTLTAASGYTFDGLESNAFIHSDAASVSLDGAVVTIGFKKTDPAPVDVNLPPIKWG